MAKRPDPSTSPAVYACDHCGSIGWEIYQDGRIVCSDCDEEATGVRVRVLAAVENKRKR